MSNSYFIAKKYLNEKNYKKSILNFLRALKENNNPEQLKYILTDFGYLYLKIEEFDNSLLYLNKALKIDPDFIYSNYNKACILHYLHRYEEEEIILNHLINKHPTYNHSYYQLALVLNTKTEKDYEPQKIIKLCDKYIELTDNFEKHKGYFLKSITLYNIKLFKEAKENHNKSINLNPFIKPLLNQISLLKQKHNSLSYNYEIIPLFNKNIYLSTLNTKEYNINNILKNLVLQMEKTYNSENVSSNGGWQSPKRINFLETTHHKDKSKMIYLEQFKLYILENVSNYIKTFNYQKDKTIYLHTDECWANINRKNNFNHKHNHMLSTISGCYYIDSGFTEKTKNTSLIMYDYNDHNNTYENDLFGKEGTLALWDGELYHSVPPHTGTKERITIAFNINLILK
tara:strand:+ start:1569 stop:2768 length:1200 start_codon:yes stop_codon:yes gene_type:complete